MRVHHLLLMLVLLLDSCVTELDMPVVQGRDHLVVDGLITDQPGPYTVELSWSSPLESDPARRRPVSSATVRLVENGTSVYELAEAAAGVYQTDPDFKATIGRDYKLTILTEGGDSYESIPAKLEPAGVLSNVYFEVKENVINQGDLTKPQDAILFYIDGMSEPEATRLLRWRWRATYQIHSEPGKRTRYDRWLKIFVPDPPACSGYGIDEDGNIIQHGVCSCCDCWVTEFNTAVLLSDVISTHGTDFNKVYVGLLPLKNIYFYDKLLIQAEQLSLSEDVFRFWTLAKTQQESAGNIFQPNVVKVKGNIVSLTNPAEEVFGIFSVSSMSSGTVEIRLSDLQRPMPALKFLPEDCRIVSGGTNVRPPFY